MKKSLKFPNIYRIITDSFVALLLRVHPKGSPPGASPLSQPLKKIRPLKIRFKAEHIMVFIVSTVVMLAIGFSGSKLYKAIAAKSQLEVQRQAIAVEMQFWQGIIKTYPNYRDGYFRLATLEYELGNRNKAKEYVQKALELDPNFEEGRRLERMFLEK